MTLRDTLAEIYEEHGELTAQMLVDLARSPSHVLHNQFEWNDAVAGEEYRRGQARRLIARVKVRYASPTQESHTVKARAYHSVHTDHGQVYRSTDDVVVDPFARRLLLQRMRWDFEAMQARYAAFEELWAMLREAVDNRQLPAA